MTHGEWTGRAGTPDARRGAVRAYLRRFFTCWVAEDPDPTYSSLDCSDGLDRVPDPVCQPRLQVPESREVSEQAHTGVRA